MSWQCLRCSNGELRPGEDGSAPPPGRVAIHFPTWLVCVSPPVEAKKVSSFPLEIRSWEEVEPVSITCVLRDCSCEQGVLHVYLHLVCIIFFPTSKFYAGRSFSFLYFFHYFTCLILFFKFILLYLTYFTLFANKGPSSESYGFSSGHVWV